MSNKIRSNKVKISTTRSGATHGEGIKSSVNSGTPEILPENKGRSGKGPGNWSGTIERSWLVPFGLLVLGVVVVGFVVLTNRQSGSEPKPISTVNTSDIHSLSFSPSEPDTIFFGSHSGLLKSLDGGRKWQTTSITNRDAMGLGISGDGKAFYLGGHGLLMKSPDKGQTWQSLVEKLPGTDVHGLAVDPASPSNLYIFVVGSGLLKSVDGGQTWQVASTLVPDSTMNLAYGNRTLWLGTMDKGLLRSKDDGKTLESAGGSGAGAGSLTGMVSALAFQPNSNTLYAGTGDGLFRSQDGGNSWTKLGYTDGVGALAVSPTNPKVIVLVRPGGEVYRSEDGGLSWPGKG